MPLELIPQSRSSSPDSLFSFGDAPDPHSDLCLPSTTKPNDTDMSQSPTAFWLPSQNTKMSSAHPLQTEPAAALFRCPTCLRSVLASAMVDHASRCEKQNAEDAATMPSPKSTTRKGKRKATDAADTSIATSSARSLPMGPPPKRAKRVTRRSAYHPDQHCGVMRNVQGSTEPEPCIRSITCKLHTMGAKRAVEGRTKNYDALVSDHLRLNKPNWVEKPTKAARNVNRKAAAAAASAATASADGAGTSKNKGNSVMKRALSVATSNVAKSVAAGVVDEEDEESDIDSEAEVDSLVHAYRSAVDRGVVAVPLAVPEATPFFVKRRERLRNTYGLFRDALKGGSSWVKSSGAGRAG